MAASSVLAVLAMAELIPALDTVLELLRSPLGLCCSCRSMPCG